MIKKLRDTLFQRLQDAVEVWQHKVAIFVLWRTHNTKVSLFRVIMHDTEKLILILVVGDKLATRIHRSFAGHHAQQMSDTQFAEAYLDWASARITKPSKPLDAVQTASKWYPELADKASQWHTIVKYK